MIQVMMGMAKNKPTESSSSDLLTRLRSRDRSRAWNQFLAVYSQTIMHIASQHEHDRDSMDDCYLFICEKLCEKDFYRLLSFQPQGSASFRSWLKVVIVNLCIDWRRHRRGRARPFKSISKLSLLDQAVFKYRFQQRAGRQVCLASMQADFPGVDENQLDDAVNRINRTLTSRQQWLLSTRQSQTVSFSDDTATEPVEPGPGPARSIALSQAQEQLQQALDRLSPHHRLLIKLRYQQELSLKEVARLTRLGDPFRARRHLQAALAELAKYIKS
jgi:RNA polymerase sigma factor (sigma-70 family)